MIIIIGDSWGVGEWGVDENNKYCLTGPGIGQYLSMTEHSIINLSKPAGSNKSALNSLEGLLKKFTPDSADEFFWIVTDPQRHLSIDQLLDTSTTLYDQLFDSLRNSFIRADKLAADHNITIKIIGGLCDIEPHWVEPYTNLKLVVPSWGRLLDENYSTYIGWSSAGAWAEAGEEIKKRVPHLLSEWLDIADRIKKKADSIKKLSGRSFGNNDTHPSRYGHRILKDFLYPMFKNVF